MGHTVICRVCTSKDNPFDLVDIFDKQNAQNCIAGMLLELAGIKADIDDGLPRYCCTQCRFRLTNAVEVRRKCIESDKLFHSNFECNISHDSLSDLEAFDRSNTSDEGEKDSRLADADYYCNECSMDLYNSESLQEHYESKHANTIYGWKSFGISEISLFDSTTDEEDHILPAAPDAKNDDIRKSRQACCGCPMVFYTDAELRRHAETVHAPKAMQTDEERPFQCDICYHVYTTPKGVYEHQLVKRQLRYLCATCGLLYGKLQALTRHEFCHKDETHACDACGKNFLNPFALRKHKRTVHGCSEFAASKSHICKVCGTSVSSAGYLKLHMKLHSKTGAYVCELCGERFKLNRYLQGHRAERHTGQHRCNECQISFKTAAALKNHLYRHGGTKQFSCGICGASFYTANNRVSHERKVHKKKRRPPRKRIE